jgi:hypothetical protein
MQAFATFRARMQHVEVIMTLQEEAGRRPRKRAKTISPKRAAAARRQAEPPQAVPGFERVMPFAEWCKHKSISLDTGKRLRAAGKIKVVKLSTSRIGVTESADAEFMKACASA